MQCFTPNLVKLREIVGVIDSYKKRYEDCTTHEDFKLINAEVQVNLPSVFFGVDFEKQKSIAYAKIPQQPANVVNIPNQ